MVNKQNNRDWSNENPHRTDSSRIQNPVKAMVWCKIWGDQVIGLFFIDGNLIVESYLHLLQYEVFPSVLNEDGKLTWIFQQGGAPPHYGAAV